MNTKKKKLVWKLEHGEGGIENHGAQGTATVTSRSRNCSLSEIYKLQNTLVHHKQKRSPISGTTFPVLAPLQADSHRIIAIRLIIIGNKKLKKRNSAPSSSINGWRATYAILLVSITKRGKMMRGREKKKEKYFCAEFNGDSKKRNIHLDVSGRERKKYRNDDRFWILKY